MEARWSKCAFRVTTGQIEQELSEVTRGFADIPQLSDDEMEPGEIAFDASSQPEHNTPGSSDAGVASVSAGDVSSNPETVSSNGEDVYSNADAVSNADDVSSNAEAVSSNAGPVSSDGEAVSSNPGAFSSNVDSLVDDLEGLVFSDTNDEDEEEEL